MRRGMSAVLVLCLTLVLGAVLSAQIKKDAKTGLDRIEGKIQSINKEKSTIGVKESGTTSPVWQVVYNAQTKFTMRNKPAKVEELKDGLRVIVLGKFSNEVLTAARIDIRGE